MTDKKINISVTPQQEIVVRGQTVKIVKGADTVMLYVALLALEDPRVDAVLAAFLPNGIQFADGVPACGPPTV